MTTTFTDTPAIEAQLEVMVMVEQKNIDALMALAREADLEASGGAQAKYEIADAFALAFNNANLCHKATDLLSGWSMSPKNGWTLDDEEESA